MANEIRNALRNVAVDVGRALKSGQDAIFDPTKLGKNSTLAFQTLRLADSLSAWLPPAMQPVMKALLDLGIRNVARHGESHARDSARGFVAATAVREKRVDNDVINRAVNPQQQQALIDASLKGDVATMKSIMRHNKKTGAEDAKDAQDAKRAQTAQASTPQTSTGATNKSEITGVMAGSRPAGAATTTAESRTPAELSFEKRLLDFMKGVIKDSEAKTTKSLAEGLKDGKWNGDMSAFKIELKDGSKLELGLVNDKFQPGKLVLEGKIGDHKLSKREAADFARMIRDAALSEAGGTHKFAMQDVALQMTRMRDFVGLSDPTDKQVTMDEAQRRAHASRDSRQSITRDDGTEYRFDLKKEPGVVSMFDKDGVEKKLTTGAELRDVAAQLTKFIDGVRPRLSTMDPERKKDFGEQLDRLTSQRDLMLTAADQADAKASPAAAAVSTGDVEALINKSAVQEMAERLSTSRVRGDHESLQVKFADGGEFRLDIRIRKGEPVVVGKLDGNPISGDALAEMLKTTRDGAIAADKANPNDALKKLAHSMTMLRQTAGVPGDAVDRDVQRDDFERQFARSKASGDGKHFLGTATGTEFRYDPKAQPIVATQTDIDGVETKLRGKDLATLADLIERGLRETKKRLESGELPKEFGENVKANEAALQAMRAQIAMATTTSIR